MGEEIKNSWFYYLAKLTVLISLGLLLVVVFKLSVIKNSYYLSLARDNKIFETKIPAARGQILDRKGRVIAKSVYQYFKIVDEVKVYDSAGDFSGLKFEGKDLSYDLKRQYSYKESMSLVSGYLGKVNEEEIKNDKCGEKLSGDMLMGRGGIEEYWECKLRGKDGRRLVEVDATGRYVRELGRQEPVEGVDLNLSIDAFWQDKIYKILDGKKATVVMSDPKTGKIIALVSSPGFDPNVFSYQKDNQAITNYLQDKEGLPLLNRTIGARYYPGSVFKIAVASAGLESNKIDKNSLIEDTGILKVGDYSYSNWLWTKSGTTDGMVDVVTAIKRSNDIFFYKLGEMLGVDEIKKWANKFGYGQKTGVELPGELEGIVPDNKWKLDTKGERWYLGDTYHLAIGQGYLSVTPLQVNQMTNVIANNGIRCAMSIDKDKKPNCIDFKLNRTTLTLVKEGLKQACQSGGTAWPLFNFKTKLACKTGTAEVGDGSDDTHAWLTAYGPMDNPEISITVLVERGGEGSDVAAPIVGDILKEWFGEPETKVPRYDADHKVIYGDTINEEEILSE